MNAITLDDLIFKKRTFAYAFWRKRFLSLGLFFELLHSWLEWSFLALQTDMALMGSLFVVFKIFLLTGDTFHFGFNEIFRERLRQAQRLSRLDQWHDLLQHRAALNILGLVFFPLLGLLFSLQVTVSGLKALLISWFLGFGYQFFVQGVHSSVYAFSRIQRPASAFFTIELVRLATLAVAFGLGKHWDSVILFPILSCLSGFVIHTWRLHWAVDMAKKLRIPHALRSVRWRKVRLKKLFLSWEQWVDGFGLALLKVEFLIFLPLLRASVTVTGVELGWYWVFILSPLLLLPFECLLIYYPDLHRLRRPGLEIFSHQVRTLSRRGALIASLWGLGIFISTQMAAGAELWMLFVPIFAVIWVLFLSELFFLWVEGKRRTVLLISIINFFLPRFGEAPTVWWGTAIGFTLGAWAVLYALRNLKRPVGPPLSWRGVRLDLERSDLRPAEWVERLEVRLQMPGQVRRIGKDRYYWPSQALPVENHSRLLEEIGPFFLEWLPETDQLPLFYKRDLLPARYQIWNPKNPIPPGLSQGIQDSRQWRMFRAFVRELLSGKEVSVRWQQFRVVRIEEGLAWWERSPRSLSKQ